MKIAISVLMLCSMAFTATPKMSPEVTAVKKSSKVKSEKISVASEEELASLRSAYQNPTQDKVALKQLREKTLAMSNKSVPVLIEVMKNDKYPDQNRWIATFMLGRIMEDKASAFIAKFTTHPNWMMRLASLKTLTALKNTTYLKVYSELLKDESAIIRAQAVDSIKTLKLTKLAPSIWNMLYDKRNYNVTSGKNKRDDIIKKVILTVGELNFKTVQPSLIKMAANSKFSDIFDEIDLTLVKLTGQKSPTGGVEKKRHFWKTVERETIKI